MNDIEQAVTCERNRLSLRRSDVFRRQRRRVASRNVLLLLFVTVGQAEEMPGGGPPRQKRSFVEGGSDPAERKVRARQSPVSRRATPLTSRLCRPSQAKKLALAAEREQLPIWACRDSLLAEVRANQVLILVGETGSGKSTQLPQFLVQARVAPNRQFRHCPKEERRLNCAPSALCVSPCRAASSPTAQQLQ